FKCSHWSIYIVVRPEQVQTKPRRRLRASTAPPCSRSPPRVRSPVPDPAARLPASASRLSAIPRPAALSPGADSAGTKHNVVEFFEFRATDLIL
ncbi:hypothetical protein U9M48_034236, partial [Paspalum notatum var. saurae]